MPFTSCRNAPPAPPRRDGARSAGAQACIARPLPPQCGPGWTAAGALALAYLVELGQWFGLVDALGLGGSRVARVVLGATFDPLDLLNLVEHVGVEIVPVLLPRHQLVHHAARLVPVRAVRELTRTQLGFGADDLWEALG